MSPILIISHLRPKLLAIRTAKLIGISICKCLAYYFYYTLYIFMWQSTFYINECHMTIHILVVNVITVTLVCKSGKCYTIYILVADVIDVTWTTMSIYKKTCNKNSSTFCNTLYESYGITAVIVVCLSGKCHAECHVTMHILVIGVINVMH